MQNEISGLQERGKFLTVCLFKYCYSRCNTDCTISLSHRSSRVENVFLGLAYINKCQRRWINSFFLEAPNPQRACKSQKFHLVHRKAIPEHAKTCSVDVSLKSFPTRLKRETAMCSLPHIHLKHRVVPSYHQCFLCHYFAKRHLTLYSKQVFVTVP